MNHTEFWAALLDRAGGRLSGFAGRKPPRGYELTAPTGHPGCTWRMGVLKDRATVGLYVDQGPDRHAANVKLLRLVRVRCGLKNLDGRPIDWQELPDKRACRVRIELPGDGRDRPREDWPAIHDRMIEAMARLQAGLGPHLKLFAGGAIAG